MYGPRATCSSHPPFFLFVPTLYMWLWLASAEQIELTFASEQHNLQKQICIWPWKNAAKHFRDIMMFQTSTLPER